MTWLVFIAESFWSLICRFGLLVKRTVTASDYTDPMQGDLGETRSPGEIFDGQKTLPY